MPLMLDSFTAAYVQFTKTMAELTKMLSQEHKCWFA